METSWSDSNVLPYHINQWSKAKESTRAFLEFISFKLRKTGNFLDLGSGGGAATYFLSQFSSESSWTGIDLDANLVEIANRFTQEKGVQNLNFTVGDARNFRSSEHYDGVVSLQTLSWLDDFRPTFANVFKNLEPDWFAVSSLFYEGEISAYTTIFEHENDRVVNYNTYSIPEVERFAKEMGYEMRKVQYFDFPFDLPKPSNKNIMGTYTLKIPESGKPVRLQVSGPILMNWYMLLFDRGVEFK